MNYFVKWHVKINKYERVCVGEKFVTKVTCVNESEAPV